MKYAVRRTARFRKELRKMLKRGADIGKLETVVALLAAGEALPPQYRDHALTGDMAGTRDCHVTPDWILLYRIEEDVLVLVLTRTGTHADLFGT
ncbi:MAG: type II toxin-antitoxin system YafQ family toxin [Kiritimatiellae bacterium]|nr:type II toxin-antitoxin system YafQ family toxin [Kiritimatiellia bacterium]